MFYDTALFPFTGLLEKNWRVIRAELDALDSAEFKDWPEHSIYGDRGGWKTFGLYAFGQRVPEACARCPQTDKLVRQIPGMTMAGFSRLAAGEHIIPHRGYDGYSGYVLRFHLGLEVPDGCAIRVGSETRSWKEGESLVFDDAVEHEAWNRGSARRTVLLCDFLNPLRRRPLILNPQLSPELVAFLEREYLPTRGLGQRLLWQVWKLANPRLVRQARNLSSDRHS